MTTNSSAGSVSVPRWRMRKEVDDHYKYFQCREAALYCLREAYRPELTKQSTQLAVELSNEDFNGWSLEWERDLLLQHQKKEISTTKLGMIFKEVLPFGISPAIQFTLSSSDVYIQKRRKDASDGTTSTVYEICDFHDSVYLRLSQEWTTGILWWRRTSFIGKDIDGVDIMKLLWKSTIIPNRQRIKVYCPPHILIGTIQQQWSLTRSDYVIVDECGRSQGLISMRGTRIPFLGPYSWMDDRAVHYSVNTFDGHPEGALYGDWSSLLDEPVFGVIFPSQIGALMKIMIIAAGILAFDNLFSKKLGDNVLPMDTNFDEALRRKRAERRRKLNLLRLH